MNFDDIINKIEEVGINISRVILEGKLQEAYDLGYNDPYVLSQKSVESIRNNIQLTMDRRKMELYKENFKGVPNNEDRLEMKSYEFVESILPQIITTDEKDKIPEKGSTSFDAIREWVKEKCDETGRDIIEKQLKELYSQGRIDGHRDEIEKLLRRVSWKANDIIRNEKLKIYKENFYEKPTEEALVQMKGYEFLEEKLPKIIEKYLEPPREGSIAYKIEQSRRPNTYTPFPDLSSDFAVKEVE